MLGLEAKGSRELVRLIDLYGTFQRRPQKCISMYKPSSADAEEVEGEAAIGGILLILAAL